MGTDVAELQLRIRELEANAASAASDVRFLATMERVGRLTRGAADLDQLLERVLDELLAIFACDRAWLLHPCDPDAPSWGVPKERTAPAWPGVFALGVQIPMDEGAAAVFREALAAAGALPYDETTERKVPDEIGVAFAVQAQMVVAIRPHSGPAWLLGLHHCGAPHVWTRQEQRIFEGVAERIADALDALVLLRDLKRSERQVAELQRADALGSLAGGVAHDFNNQLLVILCYAEMLREELGEGAGDCLEHVLGAAEQAAGLTRQLLAFSRRAVLEPRPVDLSAMVRGSAELLRRAVGAAITLQTDVADEPLVGTVDPAQLEQVLVNLVTNARDAIAGGGTITIRTSARRIAEGEPGPRGLAPGDYALLSVTDNGHGMDRETQRRVFEPFFTTKERGKGTGLGLSTAYGVARQSGGTLGVESELGTGTCFTLWLPASDDDPQSQSGRHRPIHAEGGSEAVLLVEPEEEVRRVTARVLRGRGYRVFEATDGEAALAMLRGEDIDLLVTELVLPGIDGVELATRALKLRPSLKATFATGYSPPSVQRLRTSGATRRILQKPFTPAELVDHVRSVLER